MFCMYLDIADKSSSIQYLWLAYSSEAIVLDPMGGLEMLADCFTEEIEGSLEGLSGPPRPL